MTRKPNEAVADALNVTIQIVESNQGFATLTTVYPVQERNTYLCINHCLTIKCFHFNVQCLTSVIISNSQCFRKKKNVINKSP